MDRATLITVVVVSLLGIILIVMGIRLRSKAKNAGENWAKAPGVITESGVSTQHSHNSKGQSRTSYRVNVIYQFSVIGQVFNGNKLSFGSGSYSWTKANQKVAEYPQGAAVTVHYDPNDPTKSVLETRASGAVGNIVLGAFLLMLGVVLVVLNLV